MVNVISRGGIFLPKLLDTFPCSLPRALFRQRLIKPRGSFLENTPDRKFCGRERVEVRVNQRREPTSVHAYRASLPVLLKPNQSPRALRPKAKFAVGDSGLRRGMLEDRPTGVFVAGLTVIPRS